jgi:DNA repair protein RadC
MPQESQHSQRLSASESIFLYGPESLDDATILALLLSPESPDPATLLVETSLHHLIGMGPVELLAKGLTACDAGRILCLNEVRRRSTRQHLARILNPRMAAAYVLPKAAGLSAERFGLVCLDAKGHVIADLILSQGTSTGTLISPREILREALRHGATTILVWHNHPSGDCTPSREDCVLTRRLQACSEELGIPLADHLIVASSGDNWHSFRIANGWDINLDADSGHRHETEAQ